MKRWLVIAATVAVIAVIARQGTGLNKEAALEALTEWSNRLGIWAIPTYVAVHTVTLALCLPHAVFFEAGASLLFGFLPALLCVFSAKVLAASFSFWIGRFVFKSSSTATEWAHRNKYFNILSRGVERDGWKFVLLARFSPIPSYVINYALAATQVRFVADFLLPTVIGCLPMILQNASVGSLAGMAVASVAGKPNTQVWGYVFPVLGVLSSVLITMRIKKYSAGITEASLDTSPSIQSANSSTVASSATVNPTSETSRSKKSLGFGWGSNDPNIGRSFYSGLYPQFYQFTCPQADEIVMTVLEKTIAKDPRMAASLLRLHFHDCFVQGCDASILLDDSPTIRSEKNAVPNKNSIKGFEVIDEIKAKIEQICPQTVSCADILALAARGSTMLSGGPSWELPLGRRDSRTASLNGANTNIPAPNSTIQNLLTMFQRKGLSQEDLVSLSGGHTIGVARCTTFKQRLYNQNGNNQPDETLERSYYYGLRSICPPTGGDNNISPLDFASPARFDNTYFKLILWGKGLLTSDQVLLTGNMGKTAELVKAYAEDESLFFRQFAKSMINMGNIQPLTGTNGEIRKNCHLIN